ncbi:metallophosphoesterase (plasmid) [Bacillus sp. 31A1R]|uniref:Metallophosphoesterase n=1 Tax=Robertmurraya mangrovi TaxID=3098077 RepID=A0ABU5IVK9_9BACI|nr:metallophosphoesterase [Bacillus sp. 31A1R]MDZ5471173.1 metallophosphoesterase [Bacillus sp. 31A1R]
MIYIILAIVVIGAVLILYMLKEGLDNRVIKKELVFPNFPDSFEKIKIFFISDIHKREVTEELLSQITEKVDLVIIGGDLLEKGVPLLRVKENISKLKQLGPVYFVWGNNDYEVDYRELDATLLDLGVKILDNTAVSFESLSGERFILLGTDDLKQERDRLDLALQDSGDEGFKVLVSHDPEIVKKIKKEDNISLVLSGHTHGGQIRFLGYGLYEKGSYKKMDHTSILISNGYGTTTVPFRLGAKSETHVLTLKKG